MTVIELAQNILIFGDFTLLFTAILAMVYMMVAGGVVKGIYGSAFFTLLLIIFGYYINTTYNFTQDLFTLVILELLLIILAVLSIQKIS